MESLFNREEIASNQAGKFSKKQLEDIKTDTNPTMWVVTVGVLAASMGCFFGLTSLAGAETGGFMDIMLMICGSCLLFAAWRGGRLFLMRRQMLNGKIETADGEITFKNLEAFSQPRFVPETDDGQRLYVNGLGGARLNLPPGRYRFYYLPTRNWLLSCEPLSSKEELKHNVTEVLAETFGFEMETLEQCHQLAKAGQVQICEGVPEISTVEAQNNASEGDENFDAPISFCKIGEVEFRLPSGKLFGILPGIPYRAYYPVNENDSILAKFVQMIKGKNLIAIEPA
ncbi:MAG: hypothetical protein CVU44_13090 [Chloroflexi bacterium HGW-Chloroflexi-6]|nr:MAG: hypothetical protein CVU44_13090 [Chloroflexi bacterium HGW-Chloroflexi-6]